VKVVAVGERAGRVGDSSSFYRRPGEGERTRRASISRRAPRLCVDATPSEPCSPGPVRRFI
jgi:hypothetical protein